MLLPFERPIHHPPPSKYLPAMSALPSPLKSPTCTFTQVAIGFHISQLLLVNDAPVEVATQIRPVCCSRPSMSAFPSPLKSPTNTSTQVAFGFQVVQNVLVNDAPEERPTHQLPLASSR